MSHIRANRSSLAYAPSNIAVVKYMGKKDARVNLPAHGSISLTLNHLASLAQVIQSDQTRWEAQLPEGALGSLDSIPWQAPELNEAGIEKALKQVDRVRLFAQKKYAELGLEFVDSQAWKLRTANSFPSDAGIASSASSFAAITLAAAAYFSGSPKEFWDRWQVSSELRSQVIHLSREGSGSSCRSFQGPWVSWQEDRTQAVISPQPFMDWVLVVSGAKKRVSSSAAHALVSKSPLWSGRIDRAQNRLATVIQALEHGHWAVLSAETWSEAWEMHSLFHTATPPFSYWEPGTIEALQWVAQQKQMDAKRWEKVAVTLDAGPNLHFLAPESENSWLPVAIRQRFPQYQLLEDRQGRGAEVLC